MSKECLKCGHVNAETSTDPLAACPKCGAIYARVEAHRAQVASERAVRLAAESEQAEKERQRAASRAAYEQRTAEAERTRTEAKVARLAPAVPSGPSPSSVVKIYRGNQQEATAMFQREASTLAKQGYVPTSQQWTPGSYGTGAFILAALLSFFIIGIIIFVYMVIVKPAGALSVTYVLQASAQPTVAAELPPVVEKTCPRCAETVKAAAVACRFCGHAFT